MTPEDIRKRVAEIAAAASAHDDEKAHSKEDALLKDFVQYVAVNGDTSLAELAREVLRAKQLDFARWCA